MKKLFLFCSVSILLFSCGKNHSCYNPDLVHDDFCTTDCPGFVGCDGKTYCNQCEAAREGIGPL